MATVPTMLPDCSLDQDIEKGPGSCIISFEICGGRNPFLKRKCDPYVRRIVSIRFRTAGSSATADSDGGNILPVRKSYSMSEKLSLGKSPRLGLRITIAREQRDIRYFLPLRIQIVASSSSLVIEELMPFSGHFDF
jgi:hypothetical protein